MDVGHAKAVGATLLRVFLSAALGQIIVFGSGVLDFTGEQWKTVAASAIAAVLVAAMRALNPNDPAYGRGSVPSGSGGSPDGVDVVVEDPYGFEDFDLDAEGDAPADQSDGVADNG